MTVINDLHVSRYAPGGAIGAHHHNEPWFCLLLDGRYEERILGAANEHDPGDFLFCPAGATHAQQIGHAGALKLLLCPDAPLLHLLTEHAARLDGRPLLRHSNTLLAIGRRIATELACNDDFSTLASHGLAMELFAAAGRGLGEDARREPLWLRRVRDFLHDDPARDVSLDQLAAIAGRHPVHLARTFRSVHHCTLGDYVRRLRVDRAASLLRTTRRPLLDIALDCGFAGAAQFSRSFRAVHATTPSAWRSAAR